MSKSKIALAVALIFGASAAASAAELVVTSQQAKGARALGVDFVSDGRATAFRARLSVPGAEQGTTNVSKCLGALPKTHTGSCVVTKSGEITILVYSGKNDLLPNGVVPVGQIGVRSLAQAKAGANVQVTELLVSDAMSNAIESTSTVEQ